VPVRWSDLPAFEQDALHEAWPAWLRSCERPTPVWRPLCPQLRQLTEASAQARRDWLRDKLQPYRVESPQAQTEGLLTAYYEPLLEASRKPQGRFTVPLHAVPAGLAARKPWFTRQEMDTLPEAQAALRGHGIVYNTTFLAWRSLMEGTLVPVLSDWELPLNHLSALYPASRQPSPKVRALIDFLVAEYHPVPPWDRELQTSGILL